MPRCGREGRQLLTAAGRLPSLHKSLEFRTSRNHYRRGRPTRPTRPWMRPRAAGVAKDAGASDSFSYGMAARRPRRRRCRSREDGSRDDDSEEEEESEEEDEDFVKRDPDDTKERRHEARVAELGAAVNEAEQTAKDMQARFENWGNADTPNAGEAQRDWRVQILGRIGVLVARLQRDGLKLATGGAQQKG